jgi:glycosyltransferase involved in cell wall biosynthesis
LKYEGIDISWTYIGNTDGNAGEQELEKTLKLACELGVSSQIRFHKAVGFDELVSFYRSSDIFVLPTYMEGVPRVILEAQASGLPVITTSVGGIPQAVENGIDAILTSPGNLVEIVAAIQKVIQDPNFRRGLISKGLETAQKFTLESETKRMLDKVEEVCFTNEKKRN